MRSARRMAGGLTLVSCLLACSASTWGAVVFVDGRVAANGDGQSWATAYKNVGDALAAATAGDQVWVAQGTYVGCITLKIDVQLYGGFVGIENLLGERPSFPRPTPDPNEAILDGNNAGSVVTSPQDAVQTTRIDGFTIRNGRASLGGGIYCYRSSPTITNNIITGNSALTGNSYYDRGGGIYCFISYPTICNNTFSNNSATYGGGMYCGGGSLIISNNRIVGNTAEYGGGIYSTGAASMIVNNTIVGNTASNGGGIFGASPSSSASLTIANTIVAFNSSGVCRGGAYAVVLRHNCLYGNVEYNYYSYPNVVDLAGTNGNISVDPKFANWAYSNENMHIQPDSPCIDAGDDALVQPDWLDMDGQARIVAAHVDIGADESDGTQWPQGPNVIVRVSPQGNDANDGSSWDLAKQTVQAAIDAAAALHGDVWVKAGTYMENITVHPYAHVYGGFAGTETQREQRDWRMNVTILDGQSSGYTVTFEPGWWVSTIDGFTLRNGLIYCTSASPTIANNIIMGSYIGIYCRYYAAPMIVNNTIIGEGIATIGAAGIVCESSSPTIINNKITNSGGAGIECSSSSSPTIVGNIISGNTYCGIKCGSPSPTLVNNVITGNGDLIKHTGYGIYSYSGNPKVINCTIADNANGIYVETGGITLTNCIVWGNAGLQVALYGGLPAVNYNCIQGGYTDVENPGEGNIDYDPGLVFNSDGIPVLRYGSPCIDAGDNTVLPAYITTDIAGSQRFFDDPDTPDTGNPGNPARPIVDMGAYEYQPIAPKRLYVDDDAAVGGDGESWLTAYKYLQDALAAAKVDPGVSEIWVAAGTYRPGHIDRNATFELICGVAIRGGFVGNEDPNTFNLADRDLIANKSILSGDLAGDDGPNFANNAENAFHVVTANYVGPATILDGLVVTAGYAYKGHDYLTGGGIVNNGGSPTLLNCMISGNSALAKYTAYGNYGGGLNNWWGNPVLVNCTFSGNQARYGGGMRSVGGSPILTGCKFIGNVSIDYGGGMFNGAKQVSSYGRYGPYTPGNPTLTNCTFSGNSALNGGGFFNWADNSTLNNCTFAGNSASQSGGGFAEYPSPAYADTAGHATVNNCILWGNTALTNSQIDGGITQGLMTTVAYSCIQDGYTGTGNIAIDPRIVDVSEGNLRLRAGSPCIDAGNNAMVPASIVTDLAGNARFVDDPNTVECQWLPGTCGTSPIVDMGAYEYEPLGDYDSDGVLNQADQCPSTIPNAAVDVEGCTPSIPGDFNHDGDVDGYDLSAFDACRLGPEVPYAGDCSWADFDGDTDVDQEDFGVLQRCLSGENVPGDPNCNN